jgi:hypothetical protein
MDNSSHPETTKSLADGLIVLAIIIAVVILLAWRFSPLPVIFSEGFENEERNQQYLPCAEFRIEQGKLRITVLSSYTGCAVRMPNEYENYTFTASVYPVDDVHDGSINLLFAQSDNGGFEIQYRPKEKQVNFIETARNANGEIYVATTTGWFQASKSTFNNCENKLKLTVTKHYIAFFVNDAEMFHVISADGFSKERGIIKIGIGAGEVGGIAFEFDNVKIYSERLYSKWMLDLLARKEIKKYAE